MISSVAARPNHYEMLGLEPAANEEEIREAFARKMSAFRWHPAGSTAQLCIAYETLCDPARRREYDRSLGIIPKSAPRQWGFAVTPQRWAPFIAAPGLAPAEHLAAAPEPEPAPQAEAPPEAAGEPRVASFIAASLRDLARPMAEPSVPPPPRRDPAAEAELERHVQEAIAARPFEAEVLDEDSERGFDWKRPVLAVGGFVLAAGLIGTFAGLSVKDEAESAQVEPVAAANRSATAKPKVAAATPAEDEIAVEAQVARPESAAPPASRKRLPAWAERQVKPVLEAAAQEPVAEAASDPLADDPLAPQPVAAKLPIPDKVVARTIERIGYSCGEVASTAAAGGGAFNVTCTSGQTFQARPVHGRYRFRRSN